MRVKITLACTECKQRNYNMTKDKKTHRQNGKQRSIASSVSHTHYTRKQSKPAQ